MDRTQVSKEVLQKLAQYSTPTVSNVIELFELRPRDEGFLSGEIRPITKAALEPVVGFAVTATVRTSAVPHSEESETPFVAHLRRLSEVEEPRIVVYQDLDVPSRAATIGECMSTAYKAFGCVAVVSSGYVRDIPELERRGIPVFARGTVASHGYLRLIDVMVPVEVGDVRISSGTLLHADANGVLIVPRSIAPWVAAGCEDLARIEAELQAEFDAKGPEADAEGAYRRLARRVEELKSKLLSMWRRGRHPDLSRPVLNWNEV